GDRLFAALDALAAAATFQRSAFAAAHGAFHGLAGLFGITSHHLHAPCKVQARAQRPHWAIVPRQQKRLSDHLFAGASAAPRQRLVPRCGWNRARVIGIGAQIANFIRVRSSAMTLSTVLLIILVLALLGALPSWPYSRGWGYGPSGLVGVLLVVVIIMALMGRVPA